MSVASGSIVGWRFFSGSAALILLVSFAWGCAPKQWIPLEVGPAPLEIYLDGERLSEVPSRLELKANRDHTIFVKRRGYRPQLVVLKTSEVEGDVVLIPGEISLELKHITDTTKSLSVEIE